MKAWKSLVKEAESVTWANKKTVRGDCRIIVMYKNNYNI